MECGETCLHLLPELGFSQDINARQDLCGHQLGVLVWGKQGQELSTPFERTGGKGVTRIRLAHTLQDPEGAQEVSGLGIEVTEEHRRLWHDRVVSPGLQQPLDGGLRVSNVAKTLLRLPQQELAVRDKTAEWVVLCQGAHGVLQLREERLGRIVTNGVSLLQTTQ